ncbi:pilus assembly protein TadE [Gordonia sp. HY442]|uniref:TadE family type IV pilus minor pilin n=1 Tax=Gordonia zhenghanii TaxID=2911516 RepID=UPI001EEFCA3E|nr:TadE family type IV pilus minor pilin [Gordonia zhenghanii]MCF8604608.1 pilus assembly protein TadE [Gordonia zhenghanii]
MSVRLRGRDLFEDERGMVTVEAAFALAAIAVFLVTGVGAVTGVVTQIRCTDAAREVARLAAVGDESASDVGRSVAPGGARISVSAAADTVTVTVSADLPMLPMATVSARAVAAVEPNGADGADS